MHKSDGYENIGKKPSGQYYENHAIFKERNIKYVVCNFPIDHPVYTKRIKNDFDGLRQNTDIPVSNTCSERFNKAKSILSRPNAGLIAIVDLLGYEISELFTIGLDFFRTGYNNTNFNNFLKRDLINVWHKNTDFGEYHWVDRQYLFFKYNLLEKDSRIKVDKKFQEFLNDDSLDYMFELEKLSVQDRNIELAKIRNFNL